MSKKYCIQGQYGSQGRSLKSPPPLLNIGISFLYAVVCIEVLNFEAESQIMQFIHGGPERMQQL